ncbi:MAG TPA: hypothetical protein VFI61_00720 [Patescibacteria group bacterium]|nr:hypothetical protein [Patescibacteria group bacterium]
MKKALISLILSLLLLSISTTSIFAISDPLSSPNNKFGIHITSEADLDSATKLVNSNGGDWGYVTIVITETERDHDRWQKIFDQMRRDHIIPIIRLATKAKGNTWEIPQESEINNWIAFLNSLNWVIQNRYVIIGNEPNHAVEWGGNIDPAEYAVYLKSFSEKLKSASPDFFVLPAGLDASAKNTIGTMDEARFINGMIKAEPMVFDYIDGWTSHSYPNPAFSGEETDIGRGSIDTFDWELSYLKTLGVSKNLPVFITETGWSNKNLDEVEIGKKLTFAYQNVWNDPNVIAVTPFILNYPQEPFGVFSWTKADKSLYSFYTDVQKQTKVKGEPIQIVKGEILGAFVQPIIPIGSDYVGAILARNTGQSIWTQNYLLLGTDSNDLVVKSLTFQDIEPTRLGLVIFKAAAPENTGIYNRSLFLKDKKNAKITNNFSIEGYLVRLDKAKILEFFGGLLQKLNFK